MAFSSHLSACNLQLAQRTRRTQQRRAWQNSKTLEDILTEKNIDKIDWGLISYKKLSNNFIIKYIDKLDIDIISCKQELDNNFIRKVSQNFIINT